MPGRFGSRSCRSSATPCLTLCAITLLAGCSVAREEARLTYDCSKIGVGAGKAAFDDQFGLSRNTGSDRSGYTHLRYTTSRVTTDDVKIMADEKLIADMLTLGIAEPFNVFGLADDSREKIIDVVFGPDDRAVSVDVTCSSHNRHAHESMKPGEICQSLCGDPDLK